MKPAEKQLSFYLNYTFNDSDVFVRAEAILWFQDKFMNYWELIDSKTNSNNLLIINALYKSNVGLSLKEIAHAVGLHVRTLNRYRCKYIKKLKEFTDEYQYILKLNKSYK